MGEGQTSGSKVRVRARQLVISCVEEEGAREGGGGGDDMTAAPTEQAAPGIIMASF